MMSVHIFPFLSVKKNSAIVIYGYGLVGKQYVQQVVKTGFCKLLTVIDSKYSGVTYDAIKIEGIEALNDMHPDCVVIASSDKTEVDEMKKDLLSREIRNIVWDDQVISIEGEHSRNEEYRLIDDCLEKQAEEIDSLKREIANIRREELKSYNEMIKLRKILLSQESLLLNNIWGPTVYTDEEQRYYKKLHELLIIHGAVGKNIIRVGKQTGDGGYVMLDDFNRNNDKIAYSFGISDDVSWDLDMAYRGFDIYMYDHTIEKLPADNVHFNYYRIGLADSRTHSDNMLPLDEIINKNGHKNKKRMILKIDVEGAEYGALDILDDSVLRQFEQIVIEMHNMIRPHMYEKVLQLLNKLCNIFFVFHVHINNYSVLKYYSDGLFANTMEISFANKDQYEMGEAILCDTSVDVRNFSDRMEVDLTSWNEFLSTV